MVLLKSVIEVATCPVAYLPAEFSADRSRICIMAIFRDPVRHEGNQNASAEEADCIRDLVEEILAATPCWIDRWDAKTHYVGIMYFAPK
jgi:hypothetical protein